MQPVVEGGGGRSAQIGHWEHGKSKNPASSENLLVEVHRGLARAATRRQTPRMNPSLLLLLVAILSGRAAAGAKLEVDHVIIGIDSLERGIAQLKDLTGVTAVFGGAH